MEPHLVWKGLEVASGQHLIQFIQQTFIKPNGVPGTGLGPGAKEIESIC